VLETKPFGVVAKLAGATKPLLLLLFSDVALAEVDHGVGREVGFDMSDVTIVLDIEELEVEELGRSKADKMSALSRYKEVSVEAADWNASQLSWSSCELGVLV